MRHEPPRTYPALVPAELRESGQQATGRLGRRRSFLVDDQLERPDPGFSDERGRGQITGARKIATVPGHP